MRGNVISNLREGGFQFPITNRAYVNGTRLHIRFSFCVCVRECCVQCVYVYCVRCIFCTNYVPYPFHGISENRTIVQYLQCLNGLASTHDSFYLINNIHETMTHIAHTIYASLLIRDINIYGKILQFSLWLNLRHRDKDIDTY